MMRAWIWLIVTLAGIVGAFVFYGQVHRPAMVALRIQLLHGSIVLTRTMTPPLIVIVNVPSQFDPVLSVPDNADTLHDVTVWLHVPMRAFGRAIQRGGMSVWPFPEPVGILAPTEGTWRFIDDPRWQEVIVSRDLGDVRQGSRVPLGAITLTLQATGVYMIDYAIAGRAAAAPVRFSLTSHFPLLVVD